MRSSNHEELNEEQFFFLKRRETFPENLGHIEEEIEQKDQG